MTIKISGFQVGGAAASGLSSGSYYFKIDGNGTITKNQTWDANTSGLDVNAMTSIFSGNIDDGGTEVDVMASAGFPVGFLSTLYGTFWASGNNAISFGAPNNRRDNDPTSAATDNGAPCIYLNNNDSDLLNIYYIVSGSPGSRFVAYKFQGNTNYDFDTINYEYDIYFYEALPGAVDVVVNQEPTQWNYYTDGQGTVKWGISDGSNWIDGLSDHGRSIGAA